jgi:hypothetical protein
MAGITNLVPWQYKKRSLSKNSVILILAEPVLLLFCTTLSREKTNRGMELK